MKLVDRLRKRKKTCRMQLIGRGAPGLLSLDRRSAGVGQRLSIMHY